MPGGLVPAGAGHIVPGLSLKRKSGTRRHRLKLLVPNQPGGSRRAHPRRTRWAVAVCTDRPYRTGWRRLRGDGLSGGRDDRHGLGDGRRRAAGRIGGCDGADLLPECPPVADALAA